VIYICEKIGGKRMKIEELLYRIATKWKGTVHLNIKTKDDFTWIEFETFADGNYELGQEENPNAYNFVKKYNFKILNTGLVLDPYSENMLIINIRPLIKKEEDLGDQGW
jgi:hypothetical protein